MRSESVFWRDVLDDLPAMFSVEVIYMQTKIHKSAKGRKRRTSIRKYETSLPQKEARPS